MSDTSKREELIEEAAKAMYAATFGHDPSWEVDAKEEWMTMARAALAVFEQAHTPADDERCSRVRHGMEPCCSGCAATTRRPVQAETTDDERGARARILAKLDRIPDSDAVTLDKADVRAAVRRPAPAEPPRHPALIANRTINKAIQNNEVGGWESTIRVEQAHELIVEALTFDRSERFGRPVQGEPTDAEVLAAANAYMHYWSPYDDLSAFSFAFLDDMRAALRAAAAVQEGENR